MKEIRKTGCSFFVDYEANAAYNTAKVQAKGPYERNYGNQMRFFSPELNTFLDDFAIDIVKPEKLTWTEQGDDICYGAEFISRGTMTAESYEQRISRVNVKIEPLDGETFIIRLSGLTLPRVVMELRKEEPKPAGFMGKIRSKLKK